MKVIFLFVLFLCISIGALDSSQAAQTGKQAAMKYFTAKRRPADAPSTVSSRAGSKKGGGDELLALSVGTLVNGEGYQWAECDFSGWGVELFYQKPSTGTFLKGYHLELQNFSVGEQEFSKVSFLLSFSFPQSLSFPVYIGVAAGPGMFLQQQEGESEFAFDYKGYFGLRFDEANSQYFLQTGVKNHIHMLSDGQFIGWFVSSGVAYKF